MKSKKSKIILLILIMLVLAFARESFFKNLNAQINANENPNSEFQIAGWLTFLGNLSSSVLLKLKWVATFVFAVCFLILTIFIVRIWFENTELKHLPYLIYAFVFLASGLAIAIGKFFPSTYSTTYYFSRWLMGSAQSPLLPGIICILIYYNQQHKITANQK